MKRRSRSLTPEDVEKLRLDFKERYHNFKLLLSANNRALEMMADMERALSGREPFGMAFIRSRCTSVGVNVYRMVRKINRLAPEKYTLLFQRFDEIEKKIEALLSEKKALPDKRLLIFMEDIDKDMVDVVGSKMANLGEIGKRLKMNVPDGFTLTAAAYQRFIEENDLQAEIDRRIQSTDADAEDFERLYNLSIEIQQLILRSPIPGDVENAVKEAWMLLEERAGKTITVALRSSAVGEDLAESSFAGQYRSELNISKEGFFDAYRDVIASKYSLPAVTYRLNRGYRDEDIPMCVGCLVMVDAVAGGVTYSRSPVNVRDDTVIINAAWGLPKSVVDGSDACDEYRVARGTSLQVVAEEIKRKERKFVCYPEEGVCRTDLTGDTRDLPAISHETVKTLAQTAIRLERYYGTPQDVEWGVDAAGIIYVLQCRSLKVADEMEISPAPSMPAVPDAAVVVRGGVTASPGAASGEVFTVEKEGDLLAFPEGAILMVKQALPRWAPLLSRAAAVVSEKGGFAGHLANVAREFQVPALFGIPEASTLLRRGEFATVDATGRVLYRGKIEKLLGHKQSRKNLMENSPVHNLLKAVSAHIVPLNLLDPDAPEFHPEHCKTFHDITRFIHEKSVQEIFRFGRDHDFSERSSKQLYYNVPMHWWILNLDDGFDREIKGKYVKLENIVSIPMRALWRGFTAIPWEGPPAPDGKGMMSVMFRATVDPSLATGVRSKYAERNYFMISKNFCSLTSRLGFHFSTLETLVGERASENYISFQFKGGAADFDRRIMRVHFIAEILEDLGFRVAIKEDHLSARMKNEDMPFILKRLEALGYLTLHTRQLDMIMANANHVEHYRSKLKTDIHTILSTCAEPDDLKLDLCWLEDPDTASEPVSDTS